MTAAVQAPLSALSDKFDSLALGGSRDARDTRAGNVTQAERILRKALVSEEEKNRRLFKTSYEPSPEWWASNQAAYVKPAHDPLPDGFPERVDDAAVWNGKELIKKDTWVYTFTPADLELIEDAYKYANAAIDGNLDAISRETFPIPSESELAAALAAAREAISTGLGFRVLRGLPVDSWDRVKQITIFAGVSAYIGESRARQGEQNIVHLRDITNLAVDKRPAITVKGQTSGNQVFHNDGAADIVGLITLGVAETGGLSQLSSVGQTYNRLAATRRDILREIVKGDWKNKMNPDGVPLWFSQDGRVLSQYSRRPYFGFYEAESDVPPLPSDKHLALDAIHFTAEEFSLDLALQKGDLEYFNNHTVFHARTSSTDSETNARHLIRVHLRADADFRALHRPPLVADTWNRLNEGGATQWPKEAWESVDKYAKET